MISEVLRPLADWGNLDTWIVVTAALAAMACALPGNFLVLRRQSMMGDALSHIVLPGIVIAFLAAHWLKLSGWISADVYDATRHQVMFFGALAVGVFAAVLIEWVQTLGRVESSAALGVVFTTMFALGLLLIRAVADSVHIDPDCVLYGTIETVVMEPFGETMIPEAAVVNASILALNLLLLGLFYKELQVSAFDPGLATALGVNSRIMHYGLMAVTAATLVAAFESVGSILVVAMLIVPAATAYLLTDRLSLMIGLSLCVAAVSAVLGHVFAITLPAVIFSRLGFPSVVDASTAGMMAVACGLIFTLALFFGPRYGLVSKLVQQTQMSLRIAREDLLGLLYRLEEIQVPHSRQQPAVREAAHAGIVLRRFALWQLAWKGQIEVSESRYELTESGRQAARQLVRAHRLWESYLDRYFRLPSDHLHESAHKVEHYIGPTLRHDLDEELNQPSRDPHGRTIPSEENGTSPSE